MDNWGSEFLDLECYYETQKPPGRLEPWREHPEAHRCFLVPVRLLELVWQDSYVSQLRSSEFEMQEVSEIAESMRVEGIRNPLELVVTPEGRVTVQDGHHRILAAPHVPGMDWLPVKLTDSERISVSVRPFRELFEELLRNLH